MLHIFIVNLIHSVWEAIVWGAILILARNKSYSLLRIFLQYLGTSCIYVILRSIISLFSSTVVSSTRNNFSGDDYDDDCECVDDK